MNIAERIQKLGFKRWYERTLIEGHVYLVSAIFGMIVAFGGLELISQDQGIGRTIIGFLAGAIGGIVVVACFSQYCRMLVLAGSIGNHATCKRCSVYAAFNVVAAGTSKNNETHWLRVKCRKCGYEWQI